MRLAALLLIGLPGCFHTPSPLSPGFRGSVGLPHHGVLTDGEELPVQGPGFKRLRPRSPNYWGNPRLVRALTRIAAEVDQERPGTAPLVIGDLSARTGGKIPGHNSHRTGRDVDLLWYVTTPAGAPVDSPGFVPVESDGLALVAGASPKRYVRLDVERQWLLMKKLVLAPEIGVQWMFVSQDIEALLTDYARSRGEAPEVVWHIETVMLQPKDSTPHADHLHLRIACTPDEMARGCDGGGPYWQWLPLTETDPPLTSAELLEIGSEDPLLASLQSP